MARRTRFRTIGVPLRRLPAPKSELAPLSVARSPAGCSATRVSLVCGQRTKFGVGPRLGNGADRASVLLILMSSPDGPEGAAWPVDSPRLVNGARELVPTLSPSGLIADL